MGAFKLPLKFLLLTLFCLFQTVSTAMAMGYAVLEDDRGKRVLYMYGPIDQEDPAKLEAALASDLDIRGIWLSSGGGAVFASFDMGRMIRQSRLPVTVPALARLSRAISRAPRAPSVEQAGQYTQGLANRRPTNICASACGMLLAGGILRFVDQAGTVGLHSASALAGPAGDLADTGQIDRDEAQRMERQNQYLGFIWSRYMQEMGIPGEYIFVASKVPAQCMYYLNESGLSQLNIVNVKGRKPTGSSRPICHCNAETREASQELSAACLNEFHR